MLTNYIVKYTTKVVYIAQEYEGMEFAIRNIVDGNDKLDLKKKKFENQFYMECGANTEDLTLEAYKHLA